MSTLKLGSLNNVERKFVPVKKEAIKEYADGLVKIEEYVIKQTFCDGYKFRCIQFNDCCKYTRNKKMGQITEVVEIDEKTFNEAINKTGRCIKKIRKSYTDGHFQIDFDYFSEPKNFILVEVSSREGEDLNNYTASKGFIEVSGNSIYDNINIFDGSIISTDSIIEGTDGVGKSTTINELLKVGIICQDRCPDVISANMLFEIPMEERVANYQTYLKGINKRVIFLINNDKAELERRIYSRAKISDFDRMAYEYNVLYLDTFNYMKERGLLEGKMFMVDCTGLSIEEQVENIKNCILRVNV